MTEYQVVFTKALQEPKLSLDTIRGLKGNITSNAAKVELRSSLNFGLLLG